MHQFIFENRNLLEESRKIKSGLGSVAWATLEMLRRGGMPEMEVQEIQEKMNSYFPVPSNEVCNKILNVVEARISEDKSKEGVWYH